MSNHRNPQAKLPSAAPHDNRHHAQSAHPIDDAQVGRDPEDRNLDSDGEQTLDAEQAFGDLQGDIGRVDALLYAAEQHFERFGWRCRDAGNAGDDPLDHLAHLIGAAREASRTVVRRGERLARAMVGVAASSSPEPAAPNAPTPTSTRPDTAGPAEPRLTLSQAEALLRDLIGARVLACVDLAAVLDFARSLALSLEDAARVSTERAASTADALLAPALRRLPDLIQCHVRVERAVRHEEEEEEEETRPGAPEGSVSTEIASEEGSAR